MLVKAKKYFVSLVTMKKGETRDIEPELALALDKGGFVELLEKAPEVKTEEPEPVEDIDEQPEPEETAEEEPETSEEPEQATEEEPKTAKRGRPSKKK